MGFAFEDETGLPKVVTAEQVYGQSANGPLTLHVVPNPGPTAQLTAPPAPYAPQPAAPVSDAEIGNIMVQVQRFADETADEAERQAQAIVASAQAQAGDIVRQAEEWATNARAVVQAAHTEAQAIVEQARQHAATIPPAGQPLISSETITTLSAAIEDFANTNRVLVNELTQLRQSLAASSVAVDSQQYAAPSPSALAPEHASWHPAPAGPDQAQQPYPAAVQPYQVAPAQAYGQSPYSAPGQHYQVPTAPEYGQPHYAPPAYEPTQTYPVTYSADGVAPAGGFPPQEWASGSPNSTAPTQY